MFVKRSRAVYLVYKKFVLFCTEKLFVHDSASCTYIYSLNTKKNLLTCWCELEFLQNICIIVRVST
jgi:hypothetical protein